ncbi:MAG: hypothetical protein KJ066_00185 [Acidobacteria bacterium]|nr:hypothetical protein [Acidobacteriota bacterium]
MTTQRSRRSTVLLMLALLTVPEAARGEEPTRPVSTPRLASASKAGELPAGASRLEALSARRPTIYVTDVNGVERTCVLVAVEAQGLRVAVPAGDLVVPWTEIDVVWRKGDPVWDGFLKGAAIGGGVNLLLVGVTGDSLGDGMSRAGWVARAAVSWGVIGALIDAMHVGRSPVFIAPLNGSHRPGHETTGRGVVVGARLTF